MGMLFVMIGYPFSPCIIFIYHIWESAELLLLLYTSVFLWLMGSAKESVGKFGSSSVSPNLVKGGPGVETRYLSRQLSRQFIYILPFHSLPFSSVVLHIYKTYGDVSFERHLAPSLSPSPLSVQMIHLHRFHILPLGWVLLP